MSTISKKHFAETKISTRMWLYVLFIHPKYFPCFTKELGHPAQCSVVCLRGDFLGWETKNIIIEWHFSQGVGLLHRAACDFIICPRMAPGNSLNWISEKIYTSSSLLAHLQLSHPVCLLNSGIERYRDPPCHKMM